MNLDCLPAGAILVGRREKKGGEVLLSNHFELGVLSSEVTVVVQIASRVGSSAWGCRGSFRTRTRLRPSVRLDRWDTGRDLWVGREDLSKFAPEGGLALDVGEAV